MKNNIITLICTSTLLTNSFLTPFLSKSINDNYYSNTKTILLSSINKPINTSNYRNFPVFNKIFNTSSSGINTKEFNWYFNFKPNNMPPDPPKETASFISKYDSYYLGDPLAKNIYLTFDEGYENGYTSEILDILKKHNVKAAFFVVKPYILSNPDLIKRMVDEGHLVCNHSCHHPSMASIKDKEKFNKELSGVEEAFEKTTGKKMPKYFRPPMGKYSELSLYYTKDYGYKTIFWSFAYNDWDIKKQPTPEFATNKILSRTHNGAIILLHAVSKTNAEILDNVLTQWESEGYKIKTLDELPK